MSLRAFAAGDAERIAGWAQSPAELEAWCARSDWPLTADVFAGWHARSDVYPHVLADDGQAVAYGEVWHDAEEDEAELARIIVDPARRNEGLGRRLIVLLTGEARQAGFEAVWLRVLPSNAAAQAAYRAAGFTRADAALEAEFNRGQKREYAWMSHDATV